MRAHRRWGFTAVGARAIVLATLAVALPAYARGLDAGGSGSRTTDAAQASGSVATGSDEGAPGWGNAPPELAALFDSLGSADAAARHAAAEGLVAFVKNQGPGYRAELSRQLPKAGDRTTAALILAAHDPARDVARWASGELEALGKKVPGDAVQTKSNAVLSDVLVAYGKTRDMDALPAVLSFVNADRAPIRDAAREATLAYGDAALPKLREAWTNLMDAAPPQPWTAADVAKDLFAQNDKLRLQEVYSLMDAGLAAESAGKHEDAVAAFERVLARQPAFERRAEMVPAFVALAEAKVDSDRQAAAAYYRTAARLAPDGPRAGQVASALAYLEAEDLRAHGVTDEALYRRAAEADPGNVKAHAELARIGADRSARELTWRRYEEAAGAAAVLAAALAMLWSRRSRRAA